MRDRCYNCGKKEVIADGIIDGFKLSDTTKVQVELKDEEEVFMPLCGECFEKWENGELQGIEERWKAEEDKEYYSSTIGKPKYARFWTLISRRRKQ